MTAADRLDEIQERADKARDGLRPYVEDYVPMDETVDDVLEVTAADAVPALVAALRAVLDVCENYPVPPKNQDVTGEVLAGMEKLERLIRAAIRDSLGEET